MASCFTRVSSEIGMEADTGRTGPRSRGQNSLVGREGLAFDHKGHIAAQAQQTLFVEAAEDSVPKISMCSSCDMAGAH
ncbi:Kinesin-Like Protein Kif20A [Manis pentadactyla]|nr:Kinesin-Like Protein Kif20A [Manis pentadactyla]